MSECVKQAGSEAGPCSHESFRRATLQRHGLAPEIRWRASESARESGGRQPAQGPAGRKGRPNRPYLGPHRQRIGVGSLTGARAPCMWRSRPGPTRLGELAMEGVQLGGKTVKGAESWCKKGRV